MLQHINCLGLKWDKAPQKTWIHLALLSAGGHITDTVMTLLKNEFHTFFVHLPVATTLYHKKGFV